MRDRPLMDARKRVAPDREIKAALELAPGRGLIAVKVLTAVTEHPDPVRDLLNGHLGRA